MSTINKQRSAAVRKLKQLGYTFAAGDWMHPTGGAAPAPAITDGLHALLVKRADDLEGCTEGSAEKRELAAITVANEAYEAVRWPLDERKTEGLVMSPNRRLCCLRSVWPDYGNYRV